MYQLKKKKKKKKKKARKKRKKKKKRFQKYSIFQKRFASSGLRVTYPALYQHNTAEIKVLAA